MAGEVSSAERLASALEAAGDPDRLGRLIVRAREGYYGDYSSPLAMPIAQLVHDLTEAGHPEIAERAKLGEFDGTKAEADAWARSPEGQQTFRDLLEGR